ncbi:MAG: gliding motility-associated C-terminal domain-containing protein [Saprospiraceae bacterium]|nr:gliding motility-associated C-terminal domain-containing protein [Saprospiraceae bacterium]
MVEKPDGSWLFAATANGPLPQSAVLLNTDTSGAVLWANRLDMPYALNWSPKLTLNAAGDVVVFNYETPVDQPVADMMCFSPAGQFRWARRYDRCHSYGISEGIATNDGGLAGLRFRPGGHLFVKTDDEGQCTACVADSLNIPVSPLGGSGAPLYWEQLNLPPINPASMDFVPFTATVTDFCGNSKAVDSLLVTPLQPCTNQPVSAQTIGTGQAEDYNWTFTPGTPATSSGAGNVSGFTFVQAGPASVQVVVTDGFCIDTFMQELLVQAGPPLFDLGPDTLLCSPEPGLVFDLSSTVADAYTWSDGFAGPQRVIQSAGVYTLEMESFGCTLSDTIEVRFADVVSINLPGDTLVCGIDSLLLDISFLDADTYLWSDGKTSPSRFFSKTGYYGITAYLGPCPASDYLYVGLVPAPPPLPDDTLVCEGVGLRLDVGKSTQGYISWNDAPGYANFVFDSAGMVRRKIVYENCLFEDSVLVLREDCFVNFDFYAPNVFSPNGDGENDRFELFGAGLEVLHLQVYDRWGAMIFENNDAPSAWWEGSDVQPGVYTWVAKVRQLGREGRVAGGVAVVR